MTRSPVVLGLDFGGTKIAVAVGDLSGRRLGATTVDSLAEAGADAAMARGLAAARDLLADVAPEPGARGSRRGHPRHPVRRSGRARADLSRLGRDSPSDSWYGTPSPASPSGSVPT